MLFITLVKFRGKPSKELLEKAGRLITKPPKGVKVRGAYWTLGRYDAVWLYEAPNEKEAMKIWLGFVEGASSETLLAVSREEAVKLL